MGDTTERLREGVLNHLEVLEIEALQLSRQQQLCSEDRSRVDDLRIMLEKLRAHRDQLKARAKTTMSLQQLRTVCDQSKGECNDGDDINEEGSSRNAKAQLSLLIARRAQLKDLLWTHHLIGGYDVTPRGKGMCISIATAFEDLCLETYNLELDVSRTVKICRHNIPPFIPLEKLAQVHLQTDLTGFLSALSNHLNGFAGRRQQVKLIQEVLQDSVELMESNMLFSNIVFMCTDSGENGRAVLCTLEYLDLSRYLPTKVIIESEDKVLPSTPQWKESQSLLLCSPAHTAFQVMKMKGQIV